MLVSFCVWLKMMIDKCWQFMLRTEIGRVPISCLINNNTYKIKLKNLFSRK